MTAETRLAALSVLATLLTASSYGGVFRSGTWLPATTFVAVAGVLGCELARRLRVPRLLVPLGGLVGLTLALTFSFARDLAVLSVLPTPAVLDEARALVQAGLETIRSYAAPVEPDTGVIALTAAGLGLVAVLVDTFAATWRRPALAGLPLLGAYSVPAALAPAGTGWLAFAAGGAGWLALLLSDARDRVGRWGRTLPGSGRTPRETAGPLGAVGRRIGVAALGLAVLVPATLPSLVPAVEGGLLPSGSGPGPGRGNSTVNVVNPILDLGQDLNRPDNRQVIRYRTDDDDPGYLRMVVLDDFSGDVWQPTRLRVPRSQTVIDGFADPPGLASSTATREVVTEISIQALESRWLPLPYPAVRVQDIEGEWLWDESTFNVFPGSEDVSLVEQDYTVESLEVMPSRVDLRGARAPGEALDRYLELPDLPGSIAEAAQEVTDPAASPYDTAVALQAWFRSGAFTYNERAPEGTGLQAIEQFLVDRQGFCVHFASTMAVMARALGIPARVAVGFLPGQQLADDTWVVGTHDAHAWPELYFEGAGWLAFEPTPAVQTGSAPLYTRPFTDPRDGGAGTSSAAPTTTSGAGSAVAPTGRAGVVRPEDRLGGGAAGSAETGPQVSWRAVLIGLAGLLVLLVPATVRAGMGRWRWWRAGDDPAARARAGWRELLDLAADYRLSLPAPATPRRVRGHVQSAAVLRPAAEAALGRLAGAVERVDYAPTVGPVGDLRADVATIRAALHDWAGWRRRLRARWAPASTVRLVHLLGERSADVLDGVDRGLAALRLALRRRFPGWGRRPAG